MTLNLWRFTDGKAGHDSQSIGLCSAIEEIKPCKRFDINIDSSIKSFGDFFLSRFPKGNEFPDPDLIIGAGHGTHLPMLSARRARSGKIIVLMKPTLPLSFFDMCLIPKHDDPPEKKNVITTTGALNTLKNNDQKNPNLGLILLGGPSKHCQWKQDLIIGQISKIINLDQQITWIIADSPRTPISVMPTIAKLGNQTITPLNYRDTKPGDINKFIFDARLIWISNDSISMIYEALTSGASVGLLDAQQKEKNRLSQAIDELIKNQVLTTFKAWEESHQLNANVIKLNEAKRCASILSERGFLD